MQLVESKKKINVQTSAQGKRLLLVGPTPPPIGGSPLTMQAMLEELDQYPAVQVVVVNTSPGIDVRKKMTGFNFEKVKRSLLIVPQYIREIKNCDATLVFANDLFAITLAPLLLFLAKLFRKPFYLKPVGAGLDLFINAQKKIFREYLLFTLRAADGILTQTKLLENDLRKLGCANAHYLPGCRPLSPITLVTKEHPAELRMIYLGHITRLKGILILLDALKTLSQICEKKVTCDFFGPIHDEIHDEFINGIKSDANAHYCGVAEAGTGPQLIAQYDALVLPTYYATEGHPGVLIEAMNAGVPAIATQVRTFPELIKNGVNGFLVPTQNSILLAKAIRKLALDPDLRRRMGQANYLKSVEFRSDTVVAKLLKIIFPDEYFVKEY